MCIFQNVGYLVPPILRLAVIIQMVAITIRPRNRKLQPIQIVTELDSDASILFKKTAFVYELSIHRVRLTIPGPIDAKTNKAKNIALNPDSPISSYGINEETVVYFKDIGPQLAWRTVFILEYLGPLLIHPFFYYAQKLVYGSAFEHDLIQKFAFSFAIIHFLKREYETIFVHKFSLATMPFFNLFKNSGHYWFLSGVNLGYFIYAPRSYSESDNTFKIILFHRPAWSPYVIYGLTAVWTFSELSNLITHLNLASLRADGSKDHKIPYGYGFNWVSCPNYFFESLGWFTYSILTGNWTAWLFYIAGTGQMFAWALKKHKRYKREFGDKYPRKRKVMFPFFL